MIKFVSIILALASAATAYPHEMLDLADRYPSALEQAQAVMRNRQLEDAFNASAQHVGTYGHHQFVLPTAADLRGPCPGLNALANHGYIPRNGYTTVHEVTEAVMKVFGLGSDLALFLATYAAVVSGDLTAWSIGGPPSQQHAAPSAGQITLGDGISYSHNIFEADASPTHPDTLNPSLTTTATKSRTSLFAALYSLQSKSSTANYDVPLLTSFRADRYHTSVAKNPYFFNGPFTGLLIQPKSYLFIYRLMANHSAEFPAGRMDQETLKSFFAMKGPNAAGGFTHQPGHEQIPDAWYRRSTANAYDNKFFLADTMYMGSRHPEFLAVGGNAHGRANSYREVNLNKLTSGTYGTADGKPYDFACLGYQSALHGVKKILSLLYLDEFSAGTAADTLRSAAVPLLEGMKCPRLRKIEDRVLEMYDGFHMAGSVY